MGSQECLDSPHCSHFLHFRHQDKGEKGSLAFFHMVYFYAVFQKLLQECSVGRWTRVALYWLPLTCQLRRICGYGQDHCWPGSLGSSNIISIHPPTTYPPEHVSIYPHSCIHPSIYPGIHPCIHFCLLTSLLVRPQLNKQSPLLSLESSGHGSISISRWHSTWDTVYIAPELFFLIIVSTEVIIDSFWSLFR